jgi:flagellar biosynthesis/type III secretory pathway protein FliH
MISRTENRIKDFLYHDNDFIQTEQIALEFIKEYVEDYEEPDFLDQLSKVYDMIMEQAYLEGYKDGLEKKTKENLMENISEHINIKQAYEIVASLGIKPGR